MATTIQNKELEDPAAKAALKVTGSKGKVNPLDANNKLSSASAATSLKHAQPRDLPSFPSTGIANKQASAGAAASLAFAGQKSFEHWKPEQSKPAGKAALLAHDSKPPEFWQPEASVAGSKAALLAHKNTTGVDIWQPDATSDGNSAAGLAYQGKGKKEPTPQATPALGDTRRRRAESIPTYTYPDSVNSASNALKAATKASGPKQEAAGYNDLPGFSPEEAARIHKAATTNMDRSMYTSAPPVAPEIEEKNRQAGLRAAAVSMAKNMMAAQEKAAEMHQADDGTAAARASAGKRLSTETDRREAAMQYLNLQDAAQKLAAERLAKINDESEEYRKYYGAFSPNKSRLSLRARRRSSSDGQLDSSDRARSEKIRNEMSLFNSKLAEVDSKKRQTDRDNLLAAAQKNVQKNMKGLDERVFLETGKASPAMQAEWEAQARAKAEKDSKARMENYGKVHIGGGQYMTQAEIDAIAAAKVQPTLDEVTRKAEAQRALDEQRRQEAEERQRLAEAKAAEEKERNKQTKQMWSKFKAEEKEKDKERKKEEKEQEKAQREVEEVQQIYQNTDQERKRKAQAKEEEARQAALAKEERERQAKVDREWKQMKDAEKREKEEEKARKNTERRKSRIGSMFASIRLGDREKKDEAKDTKGKSPEVAKSEASKSEPVVPEPPITESTELEEEREKEEELPQSKNVPPTWNEKSIPVPAFVAAAVDEVMNKIKHDDTSKDEPTTTEEKHVDSVDPQDDKAILTSVPEIGTSQTDALKPAPVPAPTTPEVLKTVIPAETVVTPTPKGTISTTIPAKTVVTPVKKPEKEGNWFKRKFSRSSKEQPGTIGRLDRGQDDGGPSSTKDIKISKPALIGSSAIATGAAAESFSSNPDNTSTEPKSDNTAVASSIPPHMSSVHRSETETNLSERDVALAGKEDPTATTTAVDSATATSDEQANRSRSTSISSLNSQDSGTPTGSMRGVASAALAASQQLDAQEALRQQDESTSNKLSHVDTSATADSSADMYEEARDNLEELQNTSTGTTTTTATAGGARSVSGGSGGKRDSKFHEEL